MFQEKGISLIEIIIGISIFAIIASFSILNLFGYRLNQALDLDAKLIVSALRDAQNKAIIQEEDSAWGVFFENVAAGAQDYYEVFKGDDSGSGVLYSKTLLKSNIEFEVPSEPGSLEVVFDKLSGLPDSALTVKIKISGVNCASESEKCRDIILSSNGVINIQ